MKIDDASSEFISMAASNSLTSVQTMAAVEAALDHLPNLLRAAEAVLRADMEHSLPEAIPAYDELHDAARGLAALDMLPLKLMAAAWLITTRPDTMVETLKSAKQFAALAGRLVEQRAARQIAADRPAGFPPRKDAAP